MKKTVFALIFFTFVLSMLTARQGVMAGTNKLRVSQTEFFDIIYSEENSVTARILYENADNILRELSDKYGAALVVDGRFPVVITKGVEQFNAYFTFFPYNHIVVYDTAMFSDLAVFSQTVLSVFTHELTHAVTYNLKSPFFAGASLMFGDPMGGHYLTVTSGMAEGATVSYESSKGEGRLNDPYALQMVRQSKIENKFPSYSDVKGASDAYPRNSFYYFNGAFAEYLQRTFGMHKYAEFWYRCVNLKNLTAGRAFKKTFGIKLDKAWKMFRDSYSVPEVNGANPIVTGQAEDFFVPKAKKGSVKNNSGALYSDLCVSSKGIYYIDDSSSSVYFVDSLQIKKGGTVTPQKLFHYDYIDSLKVSSDGRFAAIGYYSTMADCIKHKAAIYDIQNKSWFYIEETSVVAPAILEYNGQFYCAYQKYEPQKYSIVIQQLKGNSRLTGMEKFAVLNFGEEEVPTDFTDLGNGNFAFIKKSALDYSICVASLDCSELTEYKAPVEGMRLRNLSADFSAAQDLSYSRKLAFSWGTKETLPRLGFLDLQTDSFSLSQENISGGVYSPVIMENIWYKGQSSEQGQVLYIGQFFNQNRILRLNENEQEYLVISDDSLSPLENAETGVGESEASIVSGAVVLMPQEELPYKPYSYSNYIFDGFLFPYPFVSSRNFINHGDMGSYDMSYGFTYFTSTPWTSGITKLAGGYGPSTKSGAFSLEYQGGTDTSVIGYDIASSVEFDKHGFKQTYAMATVSSSFNFGKRSAFLVSAAADVDYGRVSYTDSNKKIVNDCMNVYFRTSQTFATAYSNIVSSGPGTYERAGFNFSAGIIHSYLSKLKPEQQKIVGNYDLGFDFLCCVPKLLPITCYNDFTYNFPAKLQASLFPLNQGEYSAASLESEVVLFGYDIQKAFPAISALFINDVIVTLKYTGGFDYADSTESGKDWHIAELSKYILQAAARELKYRDYGTVKVSVGFTPNVGTFANSQFRNNFYLSYSFGEKANLPEELFSFGFEAQF